MEIDRVEESRREIVNAPVREPLSCARSLRFYVRTIGNGHRGTRILFLRSVFRINKSPAEKWDGLQRSRYREPATATRWKRFERVERSIGTETFLPELIVKTNNANNEESRSVPEPLARVIYSGDTSRLCGSVEARRFRARKRISPKTVYTSKRSNLAQ